MSDIENVEIEPLNDDEINSVAGGAFNSDGTIGGATSETCCCTTGGGHCSAAGPTND